MYKSSCTYVFYVSERVQLKRTDYPLVVRILQGPCEHVCKIFLMEQDLGEEIPYEVSVCVRRRVDNEVTDTEIQINPHT